MTSQNLSCPDEIHQSQCITKQHYCAFKYNLQFQESEQIQLHMPHCQEAAAAMSSDETVVEFDCVMDRE